MLLPRPSNVDRLEWRSHLAEKERQCREEAEKEKNHYKAIIAHDELHEAYEKMLKEAEEKLVRMYEKATVDNESQAEGVIEEVNEEVVGVLRDGMGSGALERVDLSGRRLRILPEAFGKIQSLVVLNLSKNQLEVSLKRPSSSSCCSLLAPVIGGTCATIWVLNESGSGD